MLDHTIFNERPESQDRAIKELQAMGCQTIAGKVDRKYFYEQFYGTRSNERRD